jgi:hypothetical protein
LIAQLRFGTDVQRLFLLAAAVLYGLYAVGMFRFLPDAVDTALYLLLLVWLPGLALAAALFQGESVGELLAIGAALGISQWMMWARIWLLLGQNAATLHVPLSLGFAVITSWLIWRGPRIRAVGALPSLSSVIVSLPSVGVLLLIVGTVWQIHAAVPPAPASAYSVDKWVYLAVIERFASLSGDYNWLPDLVTLGSNSRLTWNPWMLGLAHLRAHTGADPLALIFVYLKPLLWAIPLMSYGFFCWQVFRDKRVVLFCCAMQLLAVINLNPSYTLLRLEEDKVIAIFALLPFAWAFALRAVERRSGADVVALAMVTMALAFIHPMGVPAALITCIPLMVLMTLIAPERRASAWAALAAAAAIGIWGIYTLWERSAVLETPYVTQYLSDNTTLPQFGWLSAPLLLTDLERLILVTIGIFALVGVRNRSQRIVLCLALTIALCLSVPVLTAAASRVLTNLGVERLRWVLPLGLSVASLVVAAFEQIAAQWGRWRDRLWFAFTGFALVALLALTSYGAWAGGSRWLLAFNPRSQILAPLPAGLWEFLLSSRAAVGSARIVAPHALAPHVLTAFPAAEATAFHTVGLSPTTYFPVQMLYETSDPATAHDMLALLAPEVLLLPTNYPLAAVMEQYAQDWGLAPLAEHPTARLYTVADAARLAAAKPPGSQMVLSVADSTLAPGACTDLSWDTSAISDLALYLSEGRSGQLISVGTETGTEVICPTKKMAVVLRGKMGDGSPAARAVLIAVQPGDTP